MAAPSANFKLSSTQTALAVLVPEHLQSGVNALRSIHDKAYGKWPPHINILYPFVDPLMLSAAVSVLRESLWRERPKRVRLSDVGTFTHRKNATVFLEPERESEEALCDLRKFLTSALGRLDSEGTYDGQFRPHLTIGQAALNPGTIDKLVGRAKKLDRLQWRFGSLAVMRRQASGEMKVVENLPFGLAEDEDDDSESADSAWRPCYTFSDTGGWSQTLKQSDAVQGVAALPALKLDVSTYNIMAESFAPPFSSRLPLIIESISSAVASSDSTVRVLCLQEVAAEYLPLLLSSKFIQAAYPFSSHCPTSLLPSHRNLVTLASTPFKSFTVQFPERHKSALIIRLDEFNVTIANVHLTSGLTDHSVQIKKNQMHMLASFLAQTVDAGQMDAILAGDFNLTTSSETLPPAHPKKLITAEPARLVDEVIDYQSWEDAFFACEEEGRSASENHDASTESSTFDRLNNSLAAMSMSKIQVIDTNPQRYDRVLFRRSRRVNVERYLRFGLPSEKGICASDHYGVAVTLRIERESTGKKQTDGDEQHPALQISGIDRIEDGTDLLPLVEPHLPSEEDQNLRQEVLHLLQHTLSVEDALSNIVLAPLGSYAMGTYFADSDVDVLVIGSIPQAEFFSVATSRLKAIRETGSTDDGFRAVHLVNSLVPVIEAVVNGIKVDIQYCQAAELLERYRRTFAPLFLNFGPFL
jgi:2'-5' RNA ligase/endonuclease/exonuclease/phosphatase family metal-dependent hydrolase